MHIIVIGPVDGLYHLAYEGSIQQKFYSISSFVSRELAEAAAQKMYHDRYESYH